MTLRDKVINLILDKIAFENNRIRQLEDHCNEFSVVAKNNSVYIAMVGYRQALHDILSEIRSLNENE